MREIIFRGKTLDKGEWVYGNLITDDNDVYILTQENLSRGIDIGGWIDGVQSCEVIPETVGQYTGLKDKNGTRIFEGDILSAHLDDAFPDEETRGCVCWHDFGWHIKIGAHLDTLERDWVRRFFEVIGNIHDNPELLKGEHNERNFIQR